MSSGTTIRPPALAEFETRVGSRHEPPVFRAGMVSRQRLVSTLEGSREASVVLLTAPAGYGKTTLLSEWAATDRRPFAWVTLGKAERDGVALLTAIVEALAEIEPTAGEALALLNEPMPHVDAVVPRLAAGLSAASASLVLVLDDSHLVDSSESMEVVAAIGESLPHGSQLALASRTVPNDLPVGRLRAHRNLIQMGAPDLAMTREEGGELLSGIGLSLGASELDLVMEKTEGWPVAIYLAGLSLADRADPGKAIAEFAGDDLVVAEYLRDEFTSRLSRKQLEFLVRISILDRFCGELCDAVLERSGSERVLAKLADSNFLILPLDRRGTWFRFHGLLATALTRELHRAEPAGEAGLHRRASSWFAEHDDPERAVEHAIAADDVQRAGELIWDLIPDYAARGRNSTMFAWLSRFTEEQVASSAPLALAAFHSCLAAGQGAQADGWLKAAAHADGGSLSDPAEGPYASAVWAARAENGRDGVARMLDDARRACRLEPEHTPWRALCHMLEGSALLMSGDTESGRGALEEGARRGAAVAPTRPGDLPRPARGPRPGRARSDHGGDPRLPGPRPGRAVPAGRLPKRRPADCRFGPCPGSSRRGATRGL